MSFSPSKKLRTRPSPTWLWARVDPCCRTCGKPHVGPTRPACETSTAQTLGKIEVVIYLRFCILTNETLVAVPHWFSSQEWQRKVRSHRRLLEFSQKRKPPNLRSYFLFIIIILFSEEKSSKPEEPRAHKLSKCKTKSLDIGRTTVSEKLMSAFMIRVVRQNALDIVQILLMAPTFNFE